MNAAGGIRRGASDSVQADTRRCNGATTEVTMHGLNEIKQINKAAVAAAVAQSKKTKAASKQ